MISLRIIRHALLGIVLTWATVPSLMAAEREAPNILVILCDDLGYGDLGCFGHKTIHTPNLDRLAQQGAKLTNCYSASPVCSPSRAGLLTGRTPTRTGVYSWIAGGNPMQLRKEETTIAELLKQGGYDTCHAGKWHLNGHFNDPRHTQPNDHGFDYWFSTQNNASPTHRNPKNFVRNGRPVGPLKGFSCQLVVDETISWMESRRGATSPFFLFVCFHEPHEPIDSPEELVAHYPQATKRGEALYYANVENMDRAVGRLMAYLNKQDLDESTLVFFTSDNGPETLNRYRGAWRSHGSPGPLRGMKLHSYEGGIRVPGIVRWTGRIPPGRVVEEPVCSLDLLPTLCEIVGIPIPVNKTLDGTSLVPLFQGGTFRREKPLFWHYYGAYHNRQVAVRDGKWKLVAGWNRDPHLPPGASLKPGIVEQLKHSELIFFELYNLQKDIGETKELSQESPQVFEQLKTFAQKTYAEVTNEGPVWKFE